MIGSIGVLPASGSFSGAAGAAGEVVATFLAVLELCRARIVTLTGGERDCTVTPTGESTDALQL